MSEDQDIEREPEWPTASRFTVEATPTDRIRVHWTEGESRFSFVAEVEGDKLTRVMAGGPFSKPGAPGTVREDRPSTGRRSVETTHHDAGAAAFAPIISEAAQEIYRGGLATRARHLRAERSAALEARRIMQKAKAVRDAMAAEGLGVNNGAPDEALAAIYDRIQNGAP